MHAIVATSSFACAYMCIIICMLAKESIEYSTQLSFAKLSYIINESMKTGKDLKKPCNHKKKFTKINLE